VLGRSHFIDLELAQGNRGVDDLHGPNISQMTRVK
jgi:hypothetical protein